jgi:hypothetical protein
MTVAVAKQKKPPENFFLVSVSFFSTFIKENLQEICKKDSVSLSITS